MPGAVIGAVAGNVISGSASKKAAKTQAEAADRSLELQKEMYDQTREDLAPYRASGNAANKRLAYLMGLDDVAFDRNAIREKIKAQYFGGGSATPASAPAAGGMSGGAPAAGVTPKNDGQMVASAWLSQQGSNYTPLVPRGRDPMIKNMYDLGEMITGYGSKYGHSPVKADDLAKEYGDRFYSIYKG